MGAAYAKTQKAVGEVGAWGDLAPRQKRALLPLLYVSRGVIKGCSGAEVLFIAMDDAICARRSGFLVYPKRFSPHDRYTILRDRYNKKPSYPV